MKRVCGARSGSSPRRRITGLAPSRRSLRESISRFAIPGSARFSTAASGSAATRFLAVTLLVLTVTSCAYYNTFYLARKYYDKGTGGLPYTVEPPPPQTINDFRRSTEYAKKLLSQYPDSKWVDDAYLLWARALLGQNDPLKTVEMLESFQTRFPDSDIRAEATFYLGVAFRHARRYHAAIPEFDEFLETAPSHDLVPYAHLERARALASLERHVEAADDATQILERFPKSGLQVQARTQRAEAQLKSGQYALARADFNTLGVLSRTDEERLGYLFREAECLEAARDHAGELALLRDALSHEVPPPPRDTTQRAVVIQQGSSADRYGRILMHIGTAHLLAGSTEEALESYGRIVHDYAKTPLAAEAQYRIGYTYETSLDDFDQARLEYEKVKEHAGASGFGLQAHQRLQNLDRLAKFRDASGDSSQQRSEAGFLLAEQYLFELDKPNRALEEYRRIGTEFAGTPVAGKAINAQAWVLRTKMQQPEVADSLNWMVVYEYPGTEAQLAARDYLEQSGYDVPTELIRLPEPPPPPPRDTASVAPALPAFPDTVLGPAGPRGGEMLGRLGGGLTLATPPDSLMRAPAAPPDSLMRMPATPGDSLMRLPATMPEAPPGASMTPPDSLVRTPIVPDSLPPDTTGSHS